MGTRVVPPVRLDAGGPEFGSPFLLCCHLRHRYDRHEDAAFGFGTELDATVSQCEQRVILGQADIASGMPFGAALARDDVAGKHALAAENLQAEALAIGVAPVAG